MSRNAHDLEAFAPPPAFISLLVLTIGLHARSSVVSGPSRLQVSPRLVLAEPNPSSTRYLNIYEESLSGEHQVTEEAHQDE